VKRKIFLRFLGISSDNRKSKIENRKLVGIVALVVTLAMSGAVAHAQQTGKIFRIGYLDPSTASGSAVLVEAFRQELSKLGWIEGKNITIEYRFAEGKTERQPELAADLVRLKVDLIVVSGVSAALAAKKATTSIPIVMTNSTDPVAAGLVASLARPGGNVTGFSPFTVELNTKRLEILKDAVPKLSRVGLLRSVGTGININTDLQLKELRPAAAALKLKLEEIETQPDAKGLESAFQTAKQKQVGAIMTITSRHISPKESGSSSLLANTGCRLFMQRRNLSMRAVLCPMALTTLTSFGARLFTWTRF
jgi:putative tryptophan/tyrosine transport system substrate-binding protein